MVTKADRAWLSEFKRDKDGHFIFVDRPSGVVVKPSVDVRDWRNQVSHGAEGLALVEALFWYITTGQPAKREVLMEPDINGKNSWGYPADVAEYCRRECFALPCFEI